MGLHRQPSHSAEPHSPCDRSRQSHPRPALKTRRGGGSPGGRFLREPSSSTQRRKIRSLSRYTARTRSGSGIAASPSKKRDHSRANTIDARS
jgi:hypothetical protein